MNFRGLLSLQFVITALAFLAYASFGTLHQGLSALLGGLLMGLNLSILGWSWHRILVKKSIALAAGVIVLKYALLGIAVIVLSRQPWLDSTAFVMGIGTLIPTMLCFAVLRKKDSKNAITL